MDYTKASKWFQVQKVARYAQMYGARRTLVKVRGQLHMKRKYASPPPASMELGARQTVGLLGCGNYAFSNIAYYLSKMFGAVIGACMDVDSNRAASLGAQYGVPLHTTDASEPVPLDGLRPPDGGREFVSGRDPPDARAKGRLRHRGYLHLPGRNGGCHHVFCQRAHVRRCLGVASRSPRRLLDRHARLQDDDGGNR